MGWANGFPLKGIRFLRTYSPYKKMPSWGGMRQAGCGEAKTVEGALRSAIKRFRFAADRLGTLFRVRKKDLRKRQRLPFRKSLGEYRLIPAPPAG